ncbi:ectopic P granules protein 5 homolog isoform X2 [Halyomorpha halys]|uniref:ectopic P granules protein 5 homolog isoform X2 n=1 Tax=Halyomorpha halys TaxID=286706 RepID=UPI0006D4C992|nr:ectopic P granules protein 5 homolog isoform X2 [Halyomorpha halys]
MEATKTKKKKNQNKKALSEEVKVINDKNDAKEDTALCLDDKNYCERICDPKEKETLLTEIGNQNDSPQLQAPAFIENSVNNPEDDSGTELAEIDHKIHILSVESTSTDFQNNLAHSESTKEGVSIEDSAKSTGFLSLEEDEFSQLTELASQPCDIKPFTESQLLSIYRNDELELLDKFIDSFVEVELHSGTIQRHPLYTLLLNYLRSREKQAASANEIEYSLKECKEIQQRLWILESVKVTETGECQDGNPVEASHEYQIGKFEQASFNALSSKLANVRDIVNEQHSLYTYSCQVSKLKVDSYICRITEKFSSLPHNMPVCLASDSVTRTTDLCSAISVLFHFQRQPISDVEFKADAKLWLTRLVAILLRVAAWSQHMFILNHVLRCPTNVIKWAVSFIQTPSAPFNCHNPGNYLNHMIATLATIIKPIAERNRFIQEMESSNEEIWVFVDSDGEDCEDSSILPTCLKENDIIAVLNQIPLESLFRQLMQLTKRDDIDVYISLSSSQLLRIFALSRLLMKLLSEGMRSYETKSHSQFCKRLASILTHTMQYVNDLWEAYRRDNTECHDSCLIERLQMEYDNIVISACHALLGPQHKSVLQFLTALPFSSVTLKTIWQLFHIVMQPMKTSEVNFCRNANEWWVGVEDLIPTLSEVELYYVLTAVSNMALARTLNDWLFVKAVTTHLLQIGFINTSTRDNCYKISRTLLSNLASKYPALVSVILDKLKNCIPQAGNLSLYLFREIPLVYWTPNKDDLSLIEHWLLTCPFSSIEGSLSRYILSNMHWGLTHNSSVELFLKREIHCHVALLVVRLALLHCPETTASSGTAAITDTIKQMSQLTGSLSKNQSEYCLSAWVWEMLFKLRLHLMDQPDPYVWATLSNPMQYFSILPSLESLPNELSPLVRALKDKQMTAIFTALLMTSTGHSIPLICNTGFSMLLSLAQCHRYFAVLIILQHIVPLFTECQEALLSNDVFIQVIQSLVTADKTFLRLAKNLISSDFPGMIVKQFGDLIQIHLDTYRKYNLSSPAPLAQLWLEILSKVWMFEPTNTSYLMDIVLRTTFFRPELRSIATGILLRLYEAISNASKAKFSFLSWVGGNSHCVSLIPKSAPDTPWFALFALELEEYIINEKTGLWKNLLVNLVTSVGKANIDSSLKKVCSSLKIESFTSSALPIYRWSQQALDMPVDHPVLPIFWQKFFTLYLARVPTFGKDIGCVGSKFFEGLTNRNYMNRLKKKLVDCKEFFEAKCANSAQVVTLERKDWFENMAKLYNTFIFWLEEVSLQDPGVYLPALPPPYKPEKLSAIFHNDNTLWHEYVDYETVRLLQRESLTRWEQSLCRKNEMPAKPSFIEQDPDPLARISKRLQSYETPMPPPPLKTLQQPVPLPPGEAFYNKHHLLDLLGGSLKSLLDYARSHTMRAGEQSSLDCCLLELAPLLYRSVETTVTLHAACDTHTPGYKATINSLNCAGPAVISLKICEIRVCEATDMAIHNNRLEMLSLIKRTCQTPPYAVCQGSVQIEQCVRFLEDQYSELRRIGDIQLMKKMEEVGVSLFYHLTSIFTEEASLYPPLKQLVTTCVETLGQTFISEDERQGPILLSTLLEAPSLSSLLSIHFSPTKASSQTYVQLYRTLTNSISSSNFDLTFVLLTKFDMVQWLDSQKPRMSDCSQLIDLVGKALASSGQTQEPEFVMIHEVLRRQLCVLFSYDSPSHYLEVIGLCLNHSETHSLATEVWVDIINALVSPVCSFRNHLSLSDSVQLMQKFAIQQTTLSYNELIGLCLLLSRHFMEERLQYGLYGLYPKYRNYISPFTTLLGIVSHALVVACNKKYSHKSSNKVCEELWPYFTGLYAPWLSPYYTNSLTQPMAAWIQQLTDDRSILPPWIAADSGHAHKVAAIFTESIRFLFDNLPGSTMLSYVWQYYVSTFAHPSVKEHILSVVHSNLLSLPWSKFSPSFLDLDYMLKVSDTYVPYCHTLLGTIFIDISWPHWIKDIPEEASSKVHSSLLHLIIKLSNEPNVRQSGKIMDLLIAACNFRWETVDCSNYESAVNWFVMSYDPRVILLQDSDDSCDIDKSVLELLKHAGGFIRTSDGSSPPAVPRKRQIYFRACVKLMVSCYNRYKQALRTDLDALSSTIEDLLTQINTIVPLNPYSGGEAGLYISELLTLLSGPLAKATHSTILSWLGKRGDCVVAKALLRTLPMSVHDAAVLGSIMEATLTSVFNDQSGGDWTSVLSLLQDFPPKQPLLTETLTNDRCLLSLYAFLSKRLPVLTDLEEEATILRQLTISLTALKCSAEIEAKIIPLFYLGLLLGGRQADHNPELTYSQLKQIVEVSENWADHKSPWGFLGTIGIRKQVPISNRCRVMCRVFAALVLCQFPERKGELNIDQPPFIRTTAHAPGGITSNNMELGPCSETIRCMSLLECLSGDKAYSSFQLAIERALGLIRGPDNSLHNAATIFLSIAGLMFPERFVTGIPVTQLDV